MTPAETAKLLRAAAAYDRRTVGEADVAAWHLAVRDLPLDDALTAVVDHYRESRDFLMPSDVVAGVRRVRSERLRQFARLVEPNMPPSPDPADDDAWYAWQRQVVTEERALRTAILDGRLTEPGYDAYSASGVPFAAWSQQKALTA